MYQTNQVYPRRKGYRVYKEESSVTMSVSNVSKGIKCIKVSYASSISRSKEYKKSIKCINYIKEYQMYQRVLCTSDMPYMYIGNKGICDNLHQFVYVA